MKKHTKELTVYNDGYHYVNKRGKSEIIVTPNKKKNTFNISFTRKHNKNKLIEKNKMVLVEIDKKSNTSTVGICLSYESMLAIREIVDNIELKKIALGWVKNAEINYKYFTYNTSVEKLEK